MSVERERLERERKQGRRQANRALNDVPTSDKDVIIRDETFKGVRGDRMNLETATLAPDLIKHCRTINLLIHSHYQKSNGPFSIIELYIHMCIIYIFLMHIWKPDTLDQTTWTPPPPFFNSKMLLAAYQADPTLSLHHQLSLSFFSFPSFSFFFFFWLFGYFRVFLYHGLSL